MIGAVAAIDKPRPLDRIAVEPVAEWYEVRCLGTDDGICGWTTDGESRSQVIRASKEHVSATGHEVHVDTKNVESVLKRK